MVSEGLMQFETYELCFGNCNSRNILHEMRDLSVTSDTP